MKNFKKFLCSGVVALLLGAVAVMLHHKPGQAEEAAPLSPAAAWELIEASKGDQAFTILDVRTPTEYVAGHIPGAMLLNFNSPDFAARAETLPRDKTYLIYCRSGMRSSKAAAILREKGISRVLEIQGGIIEWQNAGQPVTRDE